MTFYTQKQLFPPRISNFKKKNLDLHAMLFRQSRSTQKFNQWFFKSIRACSNHDSTKEIGLFQYQERFYQNNLERSHFLASFLLLSIVKHAISLLRSFWPVTETRRGSSKVYHGCERCVFPLDKTHHRPSSAFFVCNENKPNIDL